jgi:cytoskeletal protein RodZ
MDGHGPRNQTGIARNTSRKDGIRAGAVSGPWRSQPVAETPAAPRHDLGHPQFAETPVALEPAEPVQHPGPTVVRRQRVEQGRTGLGIAIAFGVASLLAGAAWWLTGTERWQTFAPETAEDTPGLGDVAGGGIEQLSEEELAEAERAWIERTTPGAAVSAPEASDGVGAEPGPAAETIAAVPQPLATVPEAPGMPAGESAPVTEAEPPAPEPAMVAEVPEPPPADPAPSLVGSAGLVQVAVPSVGQDGTTDYAGAAEGIVPWRIGPMPQRMHVPGFRLPDPGGVPPASGRIVVWVPE